MQKERMPCSTCRKPLKVTLPQPAFIIGASWQTTARAAHGVHLLQC